jgi:hypothetical protein
VVTWFAPQPLWRAIPQALLPGYRGRPFVLRFASDRFMDELLALLEAGQADKLQDYVAQPETWRAEDVGLDPNTVDREPLGMPFKLYQAAHMRFYLVAGALACRIPGLPDRAIEAGRKETAFFVMRRLEGSDEYGFATGKPTAAPGVESGSTYYQATDGARGWQRVSNPSIALLADEERFPLFPLSFQLEGATRRILAGVVPVASREPMPGVAPSQDETALVGGDPRPILFEQQVATPVQHIQAISYSGDSERRQVEHALAVALLDLVDAIQRYVPAPLYGDIMDAGRADLDANLTRYGDAGTLAGLILGATFPPPPGGSPQTLKSILRLLRLQDSQIRFELRPEDEINGLSGLSVWNLQTSVPGFLATWSSLIDDVPSIRSAYEAALIQPYDPATAPSELTEYPDIPKLAGSENSQYVLRLVYERPQCRLPVLSQPTRPFALAPFFDPDAPLRRLTVVMPADTSTEGLKLHGRGVSFLLSDQLRKQMDRVKGLKELMDQDLADERGLELGLICSFSIPIITICALILLVVMVNLLNIIFWWLPFFKICLPVPPSD